MKINTDVVQNKIFESPAIRPGRLKDSQEFRVLATLRYLYPSTYGSMIKDESPDLQDCVNGVGIEVTVAASEDDMKASRVLSELRHGEPKDKERRKNNIESCGYSVRLINDESVVIGKFGTADGEKVCFQESIRRKIDKLQGYRKGFQKVGLAVLLHDIPTTDAENHLSEWVTELYDDAREMFDFVYVISHRFCLYFDVQTNTTEKKTITADENKLLYTIGRMTAEKELSLNDDEWL